MKNDIQTLSLAEYDILFGDFETSLARIINKTEFSRLVIITDATVFESCYQKYASVFPENALIIKIPAGEQHKTLATCTLIWQSLLENNIDRNALCLNLGGGVVGDMGGFCAATFKRGIRFVQVPTTLLSQVDASIGGKLAIDFSDVKNSIGVFSQPLAVLIDPTFLNTLPYRELLSGFAEIIKHALINDATLWQKLKKINNLSTESVSDIILPALRIKKIIVEQDPFEKNVRKALNFGHTIGHAIESYSFKTATPLTHGEAIAIGMLYELALSHQLLHLSKNELLEAQAFIAHLYPPFKIDSENLHPIIAFMRNDKKNVGDSIRFSLIEKIGVFKVDIPIGESLIMQIMTSTPE